MPWGEAEEGTWSTDLLYNLNIDLQEEFYDDHILEMNKSFLSQMKTLKCLKSWKCSTSGVYILQKHESYSLASWRKVQFFFQHFFVLNSPKKGYKGLKKGG